MTLWRTITSLGRPRPAKAQCDECPDGLPDGDPQFSAAITALGAKLAKADGQSDRGEFAAFSRVFRPVPSAERDVRRLYELAHQTTRGFESYARQIARRYRGCPGVLEDVLAALFEIAKADGAVTGQEISYLERVAELFGLSPLTFRRIRAEHLGAPADDPYVLLDVPADAPDETVRSAWRRLLAEHHPDRAAAKGLDEAQVQAAQRRSAQLNAAFDRVMRERHELVAAQPG